MTTPPADPTQAADAGQPDEPLGEGGRRALDAERTARKAAEAHAKLATDRAAAVSARLLAAEVRAAAAGKLADPGDVMRYIDASRWTPDEHGGYDPAAIRAEVDKLLTERPYLAAKPGVGFQGSGDGGQRGTSGPSQLTRQHLAGMTPAEISKARAEGRLDLLLKGQGH